MKEYGLYLNGEWVPSSSGRSFQTINPATGEILASFAEGNEKDVEKAAEAAFDALKAWRKFPAPRRGEILLKAARIMRKRKDELGMLVTREMGKIIAEGKGDVQEAIDFLEYIAGEGRRMFEETTPSELPSKFCLTFRRLSTAFFRLFPVRLGTMLSPRWPSCHPPRRARRLGHNSSSRPNSVEQGAGRDPP